MPYYPIDANGRVPDLPDYHYINSPRQVQRRVDLGHVAQYICDNCFEISDDPIELGDVAPCVCDVDCETCGYLGRDCACCSDCACYPCECDCSECGANPCRCDDYCGDCDSYECRCSDAIMPYHGKPDTIIWRGVQTIDTPCRASYPAAPTDEPYLGLEIEVEAVRGDAGEIAETWNSSELGWSQHDSSLSDGVELVTHPSTFDALVDPDLHLADTITRIHGMGARAWDPGTCGLHIHISRKAFRGKAHLWRFAAAHQRMSETLQALAGRGDCSYSRWPSPVSSDTDMRDPYTVAPATKIIAGKAQSWERYVAINLQNRGTVELRYWRGTTLPVGILGAAAVESALFHWTKVLTVREIANGRMSWERFLAWTSVYRPAEYDAIMALTDLRARRMARVGAELCA